MSALRALKTARAAGIEVLLDGADLQLTAASEPPAEVLDALLRHRTEIVTLLRADADQDRWYAEDWQVYFDERAAVAEFDGHLPRHHAEDMAYEATVGEFMNRNFMPSAPGRCAACGEGEHPQDPLLPFGVTSTGHCWLHARCWAAWDTSKRAEAVATLAKFGIEPRALLTDDDRDFIDNEFGR